MKTEGSCQEVRETWPVTVLYEGDEQRQCAVEMCNDLMRRFWSELEFDFQWWACRTLWDAASARAATDHARRAKMILLALRPDGDMDAALRYWLETSLSGRGGCQGALIALFAGPEGMSPAPPKENWLRGLARRAGLDFFVGAPQCLPGSLPATVEEYQLRADECGSVMESILRQPQPPTFLI